MDHDPPSNGIAIEYGAFGRSFFVLGTRLTKEFFERQNRSLGVHFPKLDDFKIAALTSQRLDDLIDGLVITRGSPGDDVIGLGVESQIDVGLSGELRLQYIHGRLGIRATNIVAANGNLFGR